MVVLRRDKDVGVERCDLCGPSLGVILGVLAHYRRHRLIKEWKIEVLDVDEFKLGVVACLRDFVSPFGHGFALATRPRASDNDRDSKHELLHVAGASDSEPAELLENAYYSAIGWDQIGQVFITVGLRFATVVGSHQSAAHPLGALQGWCAPNSCRGPNRGRVGQPIRPRTLHRSPR